MFHWPDHIKTVFDLSQSRIANRRDHIEDEVRRKTVAFEEKLNDLMKEVESFKKKEVIGHLETNLGELEGDSTFKDYFLMNKKLNLFTTIVTIGGIMYLLQVCV